MWKDHTGHFPWFSPLTANYTYFTFLRSIFQSIPWLFFFFRFFYLPGRVWFISAIKHSTKRLIMFCTYCYMVQHSSWGKTLSHRAFKNTPSSLLNNNQIFLVKETASFALCSQCAHLNTLCFLGFNFWHHLWNAFFFKKISCLHMHYHLEKTNNKTRQ